MSELPLGKQVALWGWSLSVFLLVTYLLCILFGLMTPMTMHMHRAWGPMLPGFEWLTVTGFLAGAIGAFAYGWYIAVVLVPIYRFFAKKFA